MKKMILATMFVILGVPSYAANAPKEPEMLCGPSKEIEQAFNDKGYRHLLDMKNEKNITQSLWLGGQSIVATAQKDEKTSCVLTTFKEVTLNPVTIDTIHDVYHKSQKEL